MNKLRRQAFVSIRTDIVGDAIEIVGDEGWKIILAETRCYLDGFHKIDSSRSLIRLGWKKVDGGYFSKGGYFIGVFESTGHLDNPNLAHLFPPITRFHFYCGM